MPQQFDDIIQDLRDILPEAQRKAANAQEVLDTQGYKDYQDWINRYSQLNKPEIRNMNDLVAFICGALQATGARFGATYFEAIQNDAKEISRQIAELNTADENQPSDNVV
jgi:L-lactate utilization protein LutB